MASDKISITAYKTSDAPELLRLLVLLQDNYFKRSASKHVQEILGDLDYLGVYQRYVNFLDENYERDWKIFMAEDSGKSIGFIIGRYEEDADQVNSKIGILEDWYVEEAYRGKSAGYELYKKLEGWFKEKGCQQLQSEIWHGNALSAKMHEKLGFSVTGILYGKKM
jgi:aminoglycoside 6'-N-acetyltransferase I